MVNVKEPKVRGEKRREQKGDRKKEDGQQATHTTQRRTPLPTVLTEGRGLQGASMQLGWCWLS